MRHPHPDEYIPRFRMARRRPSRLRAVLERIAFYTLALAMSFAFWYALFVAVAQ